MKLAVFADVHSNIKALKTVLKDIKGQDVERIFCAGDLVGYAPFPNEVIDLIRKEKILTVMGNYDDGVGNMRIICGCDYKDEYAQRLGEQSIAWTKEETTRENKEFLRNLPEKIRFNTENYRGLIVHGSPRRLNEYLYEDLEEDYFLEILDEFEADILVCGHTHKPYFTVLAGNKFVINVGSVGKPKHGNPNAVYALIEVGSSVAVQFKEVPYDYEAVARAIEVTSLPDEFADLVRKGTG
ncbi:metallophosphatase family protein [Metallumcola ferriviriculae]|uniref:Metallophosphatase family protein n=1 Tax=Metallumcola ferriviriculae TaxID=3039180 RepID=A0AAU0UNL5_9FIRM|nr:metallophosphatase family protein [Desulfitibacteraceae bacterium MK1]